MREMNESVNGEMRSEKSDGCILILLLGKMNEKLSQNIRNALLEAKVAFFVVLHNTCSTTQIDRISRCV
jgi:hypothetical protein